MRRGTDPMTTPRDTPVRDKPQTEAGRRLLNRRSYWSGNSEIRDAILAIEAEAQRLTVERLRRAIERTPGFGRDRDYAERLAAEYARLSPSEGQK